MDQIKTISSRPKAAVHTAESRHALKNLVGRMRRAAKKSGYALQYVAARIPSGADQWMLVVMPKEG